ncbi:MAG: phage major capsid protein [Deltaproteobacteria bacterium]|nr:phage major capsid protein [Deltaproteobacteria bacterium]
MQELKDTIQSLGTTFEEFKAANDKRLKEIEAKGSADPLLTEKVEKINAEISKIAEMKTQLESLETVAGRGAFGGGTSELDKAKADYKAGFESWFRKGVEGDLSQLAVQANASTLDDTAGGFTVPEEMEATIDRVAESVSAMRRISTVMSIGTDTYKKLVNQGGASSGWVGEKGSRAATDTPSLVEIAINTKEIYAMPAATQKLLDDSRIDIAAWLGNEVAIEFAEEEGDAFINGDGVSEPKGLDAYSKVANASYAWGKMGYIAGGHASLLNSADKLIDLTTALKPVYLNGASWLFNRTTNGVIRKMKDGEGNYLWRPGLEAGSPNTLLGFPVVTDDNVENIGAGNYPIYFGNFKRGYLIIDRFGIRVLRDPFSSKPYILFYTTKRVGGGITMYEAIKTLKIASS